MTFKTHLLSLGTSCALVMSVAIAQDQSDPLPLGLARSGAAASNATSVVTSPASALRSVSQTPKGTLPSRTSGITSSSTLPTSGGIGRTTSRTGTTGGNLLGLPLTSTTAGVNTNASEAVLAMPSKEEMDELLALHPYMNIKTNITSFRFEPSEPIIFLKAYAEATGRTLIVAPDVPKVTIAALASQPRVQVTIKEYLEAIEKVLSLNGIVIEPDGPKFLKVFAKAKVRKEAIKTIMDIPDKPHPENGKIISQMIFFKYVPVAKAKEVFEFFRKDDGQLNIFESKDGQVNSILVTDTQENINRMLEITKFIDKEPLPNEDLVKVWSFTYAKAKDIQAHIDALIKGSQSQTKEEIKLNTSGAPGVTRTTTTSTLPTPTTSPSFLGSRPLTPGLVRPGSTTQPSVPNETRSAMVSDADRGMIRNPEGILTIVDERTNKLIIKTHPDNTNIFEKVIAVLDIPIPSGTIIKIIRLQHATADASGTKDGEKGLAQTLTELIAKMSSSSSSSGSKSTSSSSNKKTSTYGGPGGNLNLTTGTAPAPTPATPAVAPSPRISTGKEDSDADDEELTPENTTIIADKRINGLIVMTSPKRFKKVEAIVRELDVELEQVIIETVLMQVQLTDSIKTGIDWIHSRIMSKGGVSAMGAGGGGDNAPLNNLANAAANVAKVAGTKYYFLFDKLDLNMVVSASKEDSRTKVLQSPVLMTVNNKEATLESTDMRYLYKGVRYAGSYNYGTEVPDYEQRDFGVTIKVTPRISPNGNVTLTVDQKFETLGTPQFIPGAGGSSGSFGSTTNETGGASSGGYFPTISTSKLQADVSVKSGQTVMLGGLVRTEKSLSDSGIPVLKDIPLIGRYLFGKTEMKDDSKELVVFLTPYVVKGSDAAQEEARRRLNSINMEGVWSKGWSESALAEPPKIYETLTREKRKFDQIEREKEAQEELMKLYKKKGVTPPSEKAVTPDPEPITPPSSETITIQGSGLMRPIEEKTEPLLIAQPAPPEVPKPEKAPVVPTPVPEAQK